jgi:hypothetical protein
MSIVRILVVCLIYINSLSSALECTTNCYFSINHDSSFQIPAKCNETTSAKQCKVYLSISYDYNSTFVTLSASTINFLFDDTHSAMVQLTEYGSIILSYSIARYCNKKDDCARELVYSSMFEIINRPFIDTRPVKDELFPLLASNSSNGNMDVSCFDSNERVRQCAIASKPGSCQLNQQLNGRKSINRSCDNELSMKSQYIDIYDSGNIASFKIKCNRSLCNGPMTFQAVKEVLFKYNITKTIDGRLNHGLRLSLSYPILLLLIYLIIS